ncbi:hypothetical protein A9973_02090 [Achromobacter sp. UMC46]|nr:hypothetical protein [Achromobacter sp. UMC46]
MIATAERIQLLKARGLLLDYAMQFSAKSEPPAPKDRTRGRAWIRGISTSAETTCDMRSVDLVD